MFTITNFAIAIPYLAVAIYAWRRLSWVFYQDRITSHNEALFVGGLAALVWPISLAWLKLLSSKGFMLPPKEVRKARRIKELESEVRRLEDVLDLR